MKKVFKSPMLEITVMVGVLILSYLGMAFISMGLETPEGGMSGGIIFWLLFGSFLLSFAIAIIAVMGGIGGGVLFTPILLAFTSVDSLIVRATGLIVAMFSGLISTGPFMRRGLANLKVCIMAATAYGIGAFVGAQGAILVAERLGATGEGLIRMALGLIILALASYFIWGGTKIEWPKVKKVDRFTAWLNLTQPYYEESMGEVIDYKLKRAGVLMGEGRMKTSFLQNMLGGTGQVLNQVLDKGKAGYTVVSCAVIDFPIKKGIATAKAFYIDAEARGIIGTGTANLRNETLDLIVDPRNKKKIDKAVLPVHITGTFLFPEYEIDKTAAAGKLTGMLGIELPGALTGAQGGSEAPLIEGPCAPPAPATTAAEPAPAETQPAIPSKPEDAIKDAGGQVEEKLKEGLKGLFGQ